MRNFWLFFICAASWLFPLNISSQNLLADGSFEDYQRCPLSIHATKYNLYLKHWYVPSSGSSDYFNTCAKGKHCGVPENVFGNSEPRSGNGYVGLGFYKSNFREYIAAELMESLKKDEEYYVEFWVSLANNSMYSTSCIGLHIGKSKIDEKTDEFLNLVPQIKANSVIENDDEWIKISGVYKASGGERYLVIGSFSESECLTKRSEYGLPKSKSAYYFIEDVAVVAMAQKNKYLKIFESDSTLNRKVEIE